MKNRWDMDAPASACTAGQELPPETGEALRALVDSAAKEKGDKLNLSVPAPGAPMHVPAMPTPALAAQQSASKESNHSSSATGGGSGGAGAGAGEKKEDDSSESASSASAVATRERRHVCC